MIRPIRAAFRVAVAGLIVAAATAQVQAAQIIAFGQTSNTNTIFATNPTFNTTKIMGTDVAVLITQIDPLSGLTTPLAAYLQLTANSIAAATGGPTADVRQRFAGTFAITAGTGGTGVNYLSGLFSDAAFGSGTGLTLSVSQTEIPGPEFVTFTSDVIPSLYLPRALSLALTNVTPQVFVNNFGTSDATIRGFDASISGVASGSVPEPGSVLSAISGMALLGVVRWSRRRRAA